MRLWPPAISKRGKDKHMGTESALTGWLAYLEV